MSNIWTQKFQSYRCFQQIGSKPAMLQWLFLLLVQKLVALCCIWTDLKIFRLGLWCSPWTEQSWTEKIFNPDLSEGNQGQEAGDNPAPKAASGNLACLSSGQNVRPQQAWVLSFSSSASFVTMDMELTAWFGRVCHWSLHFPKSSTPLTSNEATSKITEKF